jgi:hypothetical protein
MVCLTGHHQRSGCLPSCGLRNGREESDGETGAPFGPTTSNNFSAIFSAHALPETVFPLALEIRGLLKSERHDALLPRDRFMKKRHYRSGDRGCQSTATVIARTAGGSSFAYFNLPLKPAACLSYMDSWGTLVRVGQTCHRTTSRERNHALSKRWLPNTKYTLRVLKRELALTLLSE